MTNPSSQDETCREFFDNANDFFYSTDLNGRFTTANNSLINTLGYLREEIIGAHISKILSAENLAIAKAMMAKKLDGEADATQYEMEIIGRDGRTIPIELISKVVRKDGETVGIHGIGRDITERKKAQDKLKRVNRALNVVSHCIRAIHRVRNEHELLREMCQIVVGIGGYRFAWVGHIENDAVLTVRPVAHAGFEDGYLDTLRIALTDVESMGGPTGMAIRSGEPVVIRDLHTEPAFARWREQAIRRNYFSSISLPLRVEEKTIGNLNIYSAEANAFDADEVELLTQFADDVAFGISSLRQRAEKKIFEEQIQRLAHYDALTDLPNRALFFDRLQQALAAAKRDQSRLAVLFIDIDMFKPINDTFGHEIGDLLLREIARRMRGCLRESDTSARYGGDEFVVLLPTIAANEDAKLVADKICAVLEQPFELGGNVLCISSSIGIAVYPENGSEEKHLLRNADAAMYQSKNSGRNTVRFYQ